MINKKINWFLFIIGILIIIISIIANIKLNNDWNNAEWSINMYMIESGSKDDIELQQIIWLFILFSGFLTLLHGFLRKDI